MSKESWFRKFERLEALHPDLSDDELSDMAHEAMVDEMALRADMLADEAKEEATE